MILEAVLLEAVKILTEKVLEATGIRLRRSLTGGPQQEAMQRCFLAGLNALWKQVEFPEPDDEVAIRNLFTGFANDEAVALELEQLLHGETADLEVLSDRFQQSGYEHEIDLRPGFTAFHKAFVQCAEGEEALRDIMMVQQLKQQTQILIERLPDPKAEEAAARERYLRGLINDCQTLPLASLGGDAASEDDVRLKDIYIGLRTTEWRIQQDGEEQIVEAPPDDPELENRFPDAEKSPITAQEVVETAARSVVVLGDPGSGKSSFVKELLARQALTLLGEGEPVSGVDADLIPVFITVRELKQALASLDLRDKSRVEQRKARAMAVLQHILKPLRMHAAESFERPLSEAFNDGQCLVVFDGLDEVLLEDRKRVRDAVTDTIATYHLRKVIVTCRIRSYTDEARLEGATDCTLAPFVWTQVQAFIDKWYRAQEYRGQRREGRFSEDEASKRIRDLTDAVDNDKHLRDMARNPLLLTTMALVHQTNVTLPPERVKLYREAVEVLVKKWQEEIAGDTLTPSEALTDFLHETKRWRGVLERLAYEAHKASEGDGEGELSRGQALTEIETSPEVAGEEDPLALAHDFLDYADRRTGLLIGQGGGEGAVPATYRFPHRTFQEYLAGCYLLGRPEESARRIREHAAEGVDWTLTVQLGAEELYHVKETTGEWVLRNLICELGRIQGQTEADERVVYWTARMVELVGCNALGRTAQGEAFLKDFPEALAGRLRGKLTALERADAGRILGRLGDPRPAVTTVDGMAFGLVPAGPFQMGGDKEDDGMAYDDEVPCHEVMLSYDYWISRYPVTQAQFEAFIGAGGYENPDYWTEDGWQWRTGRDVEGPSTPREPFDLPNHPVVAVSWYEAYAYTRWLTEYLRAQGRLPTGWVAALPSEAEWEKAARGGEQLPEAPLLTTAAEGFSTRTEAVRKNPQPRRRYPWGPEPDADRMNFRYTKIGTTSAVGCFPLPDDVRTYGIEELSGNVLEWCRDWFSDDTYKNREGQDVIDPRGPEQGDSRVVRGGAFSGNDYYARCAFRLRYSPIYRNYDDGFRVVVLPFPLSSDPSGD